MLAGHKPLLTVDADGAFSPLQQVPTLVAEPVGVEVPCFQACAQNIVITRRTSKITILDAIHLI